MRAFTTRSFNRLIDTFGSGYIAEQHGDKSHWNFSPTDVDEVVESLTASMFDEMMKSLRAALSLR